MFFLPKLISLILIAIKIFNINLKFKILRYDTIYAHMYKKRNQTLSK